MKCPPSVPLLFEATPPGTDVTPPTNGVYMLFFSGLEATPLWQPPNDVFLLVLGLDLYRLP